MPQFLVQTTLLLVLSLIFAATVFIDARPIHRQQTVQTSAASAHEVQYWPSTTKPPPQPPKPLSKPIPVPVMVNRGKRGGSSTSSVGSNPQMMQCKFVTLGAQTGPKGQYAWSYSYPIQKSNGKLGSYVNSYLVRN